MQTWARLLNLFNRYSLEKGLFCRLLHLLKRGAHSYEQIEQPQTGPGTAPSMSGFMKELAEFCFVRTIGDDLVHLEPFREPFGTVCQFQKVHDADSAAGPEFAMCAGQRKFPVRNHGE